MINKTQIDLSQYLDNTDTDTNLTEAEVDAMVSNNGYIASELDGDPTNELQNLSMSGNLLSLSNGNSVNLNGLNYWSKLNSNLFYSTGKVGVGTDNPQKQLHIHNPNNSIIADDDLSSEIESTQRGLQRNSESTFLLTNKNSGSTATDGLLLRSYDNNAVIFLQETGSLSLITKNALRFKMEANGNVAIGSFQTNYFVVKESGKVGIGTESPEAALHVKGNKIIIEENNNKLYLDASNTGVEIGSSTNQIVFWHAGQYNKIKAGDIISSGNVGIGTDEPQYKLDVRGTAHFCEVRVRTENWCDYVFADNYQLPELTELELFIKTNKHLPGIPTESEAIENGIDLGEMNKKLLEKVEELTLIIIEQDKQMKEQGARINKLEEQIKN